MRRLPLLLAAALTAWTSVPVAQAQAAPDTLIAGPALQADVDLLAQAYGALHPGLFRYQTPDAWAARVAALRADVAGGMGQRAFYLRLAELLAAVRCGHSYPNFFNQTDAVQARVLEASRRLPVHFRWLGGEMAVTRDLSGTGLPPGTRVLALDGVPAADVLARLMPLARADGGNDAKRREILSVTGDAAYEAFDVYYPVAYGLGDTVSLRIREPLGGPERTVRLATQTFADREAVRATAAEVAGANPLRWSLRTLGDGTAVLTMPDWATYQAVGWDWQAHLDSVFVRLVGTGTRRLVVDLRDNEGGSDVGDALLGYLTREPLTFPTAERYVRYRTLPAALRPYADTWDRSFDDWSAFVAPDDSSALLRMTRGGDGALKTVAPRAPYFGGRVAVLVGPVNSSATYGFAEDVRRSGRALLVGQPTGGNQRGINGGAFYFFRLPGSGIEVDIPLVASSPLSLSPVAAPDAGLTPDVVVEPTADDLATGTDRALAAAVEALGG